MLTTLTAITKLSNPDPSAAAHRYRRQIIDIHIEHCPSCLLIGDCGWMQRNRPEGD